MNFWTRYNPRTNTPVDAFIRRNWRRLYVAVALGIDLGAIVCSQWLARIGYHLLGRSTDALPPFWPATLTFATVLLFLGSLFGLYRASFHTQKRVQYFLGGQAAFYSLLLALSALSFVERARSYSLSFLLFFAILPFCFVGFRMVLNRLNFVLREWGFGISTVLVVDYAECPDTILANRFKSFPELGYRVLGYVPKPPDETAEERRKRLSIIESRLANSDVETVVATSFEVVDLDYQPLIEMCARHGAKLKLLCKESQDLLRFAYVRDIAGIPLYEPPKRRMDVFKRVLKRGLDVTLAVALLLPLSVVFLIVAVAILLEDGRPIFFRQRRALAEGGKSFWIYKFRSMTKNAESQQQEFLKRNETTGGLFFIHHDPRVTKVGKVLRKLSLDELPQLLNVLRGDMSLVGPRPLTFSDLANITPDNSMGGFYKLRNKGKPGMTGLWQISARREVGFREMVLLDLYYIENQTLWFDLEILALTPAVMLLGRGAH